MAFAAVIRPVFVALDYGATSDFSETFEFSEFSAENDKLMRAATGRMTRINSISGNIFPLVGMRIVGRDMELLRRFDMRVAEVACGVATVWSRVRPSGST